MRWIHPRPSWPCFAWCNPAGSFPRCTQLLSRRRRPLRKRYWLGRRTNWGSCGSLNYNVFQANIACSYAAALAMACVSAIFHSAVIVMPVVFHVRCPVSIYASWPLVRLPCVVAGRCLPLCCRKIRLAGGLLPWSWVNYVNSERGFLDLVRRSTRLGADPVAIIKSYEANPAGEAWPQLCVFVVSCMLVLRGL